MSLLAVDELVVRLGGRAVLSEVSVSVPEGGLVTILGRNGVGKTTLLRTVSGLYRPHAGTISLAGVAIGGMAPHQVVRAGVAQAPEGRQLFGDMDVAENLRAGALHLSRADFARRFELRQRPVPDRRRAAPTSRPGRSRAASSRWSASRGR